MSKGGKRRGAGRPPNTGLYKVETTPLRTPVPLVRLAKLWFRYWADAKAMGQESPTLAAYEALGVLIKMNKKKDAQ